MHDNDLGAFIRSRREAITPEEVGLPNSGRRRTPGLRRSELATLAGVSVDYLIRLEQGRDTRPSPGVVSALADGLRLGEEDRNYLKWMAAVSMAPEFCPTAMPPASGVRPNVAALLASLEPAPAFVLNHLSELLAWTGTYEALAQPLGILDRQPPSLIRYTFTDRRARTAYPDWELVALEQVANLRAGAPRDPDVSALVEELSREVGDEFTRRWDALPVERKGTGATRIAHPEVGPLAVEFETLQLADRDDQRLVVYLPGDDATAAAFDELSGRRPGALHAVGG